MMTVLSSAMQVAPPSGITPATLGRIVHAEATAADPAIQAIITSPATEILCIVDLSTIAPLFIELMAFIPSFVMFDGLPYPP
jgi:hypothetical protein